MNDVVVTLFTGRSKTIDHIIQIAWKLNLCLVQHAQDKMANNSKYQLSKESQDFIREAKKKASFDIDFAFCEKTGFKLENHSPATTGINLFDLEIGLIVDKRYCS